MALVWTNQNMLDSNNAPVVFTFDFKLTEKEEIKAFNFYGGTINPRQMNINVSYRDTHDWYIDRDGYTHFNVTINFLQLIEDNTHIDGGVFIYFRVHEKATDKWSSTSGATTRNVQVKLLSFSKQRITFDKVIENKTFNRGAVYKIASQAIPILNNKPLDVIPIFTEDCIIYEYNPNKSIMGTNYKLKLRDGSIDTVGIVRYRKGW